MPILGRETDLWPEDLLDHAGSLLENGSRWWAVYTRSRHEKRLMRHLVSLEVPFYCPIVERRYRSPGGRIRSSFVPLFTNYVFVLGDESSRHDAMTTNCVSRAIQVGDGELLTRDLAAIHSLISVGAPVTPEARLESGMLVRVRSGPFAGREGVVIQRRGEQRLLVSVNFLQQGASVNLDDCEVERIL